MANLNQQIYQLQQHSTAEESEKAVGAAIMAVLAAQPVYGILLTQLPRFHRNDAHALLALGWQGSQLMLQVNDQYWAAVKNASELQNLLMHVALHVLWQQPLRYASSKTPVASKIACDVAVNEYLSEPPAGSFTRARLAAALQQSLPEKADSSVYLSAILKRTQPAELGLIRHNNDVTATAQTGSGGDDHGLWGSLDVSEQLQATAQLNTMIQQSVAQTTSVQRGLLPSAVQAQLMDVIQQPAQILWQRVFAQMIGQTSHGRRESHARFNRRQPQRMTLAGSVERLTRTVQVFMDESASISDDTMARLIAELQALVRAQSSRVEVHPFDAAIHEAVTLTPGQPVLKQRQIGGGTRYQVIFDWLHENNRISRDMIIVILTDGAGEKELLDYGYQRVLWVVTGSKMSVQTPPGQVAILN
ncbi:vWA domain-containing protein [Furfurilactobacillus siliginis]|uniref:VWA-like domain-containing protein n=1 Tax=Furfurilactobacillus siliginis TaxID=348151 RepID=A0A0R2L1H8_9LACO|nr:VWA-like domain-containing protein [Furfurilactobacillus siliginis]KRN95673.1 hypothetical protein IV55_GL001774 [Furfurilactobacillus siliginis]GEK28064.1 hypothetical protein LSI01_03750 [Furfurilactobacillus siliginis]